MRSVLIMLVWFIAITASSFGLILIIKPDGSSLGLNKGMLDKTPFQNFLVPGLCLLFIIGGFYLFTIILGIVNHPKKYKIALAAGIGLVAFIIAQFLLFQTYSWLFALYLVLGLLVSLLSYQLMGKAVF